MSVEEQLSAALEIISQLNKALDIIANNAGDYTQNIVYDALVEVGYYSNLAEEDIDV